jgi:hypothetical protein
MRGWLGWCLASLCGVAGHALADGIDCNTPPAVAAHYRVQASAAAKPRAPSDLYFIRGAGRVTVLRGDVEDVWHCDPRVGVSLERIFHTDQRVVAYSASELRAMSIEVSWPGLATFFDEHDLRSLKPVRNTSRRHGRLRGDKVIVDWSQKDHLPAAITRSQDELTVTHRLVRSSPTPPAHWPLINTDTSDYLHIDAADFGDMSGDAFVRKAEALDARAGWRQPHRH